MLEYVFITFLFKAGDTCKNRYANLLEFINHRERRQAAADAGIAESHVETSMVHPCYWVNHHSPHYCIDDSGTLFNISLYQYQYKHLLIIYKIFLLVGQLIFVIWLLLISIQIFLTCQVSLE